MNWKSLFFNSQSNPGLAVSGDLSDEEGFKSDNERDNRDKRDNRDNRVISSTSIINSDSNCSESYISSSISSSISSKIINSSPQNDNLKFSLSWQRSWLLIPSYSLIFLTVLPFVQGCLYTIGHRLGKKTLKFIFNKL